MFFMPTRFHRLISKIGTFLAQLIKHRDNDLLSQINRPPYLFALSYSFKPISLFQYQQLLLHQK